ncbi:MAG: methyl-accepting chemotaxis protein [Smithellaceae bacterium]
MNSVGIRQSSGVNGLLNKMFGDMKLGKKLAYGFGTVLILLLIIAVLGIYRMTVIHNDLNHIVTDRYRKVIVANDIIDQANIIAVALRNIAISKDQSFIQKEKERIGTARMQYTKGMDELRATVVRTEGKASLAGIEKAIIELKPFNDKILESGGAMPIEEVSKLVTEQLEPGQARLLAAIGAMIRYQERMMDATIQEANQAYKSALFLSIVISIAALLIGALIAYFLNKGITKPINRIIDMLTESADSVSSAAGQVAGTSQSLAEGAQGQASAIEETSASLEEMSSMTKANEDSTAQANVIIGGSKQDVEKAGKIMKNLIDSMNEISRASEDTEKIVKTIDEIAFQTNLLALNAAVEAARAGEVGAGFAVVADEVRNLAMRAAEAAKTTEALIEGTVQKIHSGKELLNKTEEAFTRVAEESDKIGQIIGEIASASREQSIGIGQVNVAVSEVDKITQQNAARAEETASASEEMKAEAEQMKGYVKKLTKLVGGRSASERYLIKNTHVSGPLHSSSIRHTGESRNLGKAC